MSETPEEIKIGPLIFIKEGRTSGMSVNTEDECLGYCEGVWPEMWDEFVSVVRSVSA